MGARSSESVSARSDNPSMSSLAARSQLARNFEVDRGRTLPNKLTLSLAVKNR